MDAQAAANDTRRLRGKRPRVARGQPLRACACAATFALALARLGAPSADAAEPLLGVYRLTYDAPDGCPDAAIFRRKIERRTRSFVREQSRPADFSLTVAIRASSRGFSGTLGITGPHGERTLRSLNATSCPEVTDALALMAALAMDPLATTHEAVVALPPPPPPVPPPLPPPPAPPNAVAPTPPSLEPLVLQPSAPAEPLLARSATRHSRPWEFGAGVGADLSWGVTPSVMIAPKAFVDVTSPFRGPLGLTLRVGFERASRSNTGNSSGEADFTWTLGTLEACPLRWTWRSLAAFPCLRLEAGELDGTGVTGSPNLESKRGWFAAAALGRLRWTPIPHFALELEGGARAPFIRDKFVFEPSTEIYQPAVVSALLGASARGFF